MAGRDLQRRKVQESGWIGVSDPTINNRIHTCIAPDAKSDESDIYLSGLSSVILCQFREPTPTSFVITALS